MKIIVKTQFEDFHRWKDAPKEVAFLRNLHRHIFFVEISCEVTHDDRELEFFMVKKILDAFIREKVKKMDDKKSCEQMAQIIKSFLWERYQRYFSVKILEDNENGAIV